MERPQITGWLFGFALAGQRAALAPGGRGLDQGRLHEPDRQHRDLDRGRHRRGRLGLDLRPPVPARAGGDHRPARPDPAGRRDDRRGHPRRRRADREHGGRDRDADRPADLPAARELRRLPDRLPPGGRAHGLHDDRRRAARGLAARGGRGDSRGAVRRRRSRPWCTRRARRGARGWRRCAPPRRSRSHRRLPRHHGAVIHAINDSSAAPH